MALEEEFSILLNEIDFGELLGSSPNGSVHKGWCRGNEVAIKVPSKKLSGEEFSTFSREYDLLRRVCHPHIVMLMGSCFHDGKLYLITELMSANIAQVLKETKYLLSTRLDWCHQAASGMSWLHNMHPRILHQDLKPSNLLINKETGKVKLCDFGLGLIIPEGQEKVSQMKPRGTPLYMAPEVMRGSPWGPKADVYSFAIMTWEILSGKEPFGNIKTFQEFKKEVHGNKRRPPFSKDWPSQLNQLLSRMWDKKAENRPHFVDNSDPFSIVPTLRKIKKEQGDLEYQHFLFERIQDPEGAKFWEKNFIKQETIQWSKFIPLFYQWIGREIPPNPTSFSFSATPKSFSSIPLLRNGTSLLNAGFKLASFGELSGGSKLGGERVKHERSCISLTPSLTNSQRELLCLKYLLCESTHKDNVQLDSFGRFLACFGSPFHPLFLERITNLLKEKYFHGYVSSTEAAMLLYNKPVGTFLVRYCANHWGQAAISVVLEDETEKEEQEERREERRNGRPKCESVGGRPRGLGGSPFGRFRKIKHILIQNDPEGFRIQQSKKGQWDSLTSLIDDHRDILFLKTECPGSPFPHLLEEDTPNFGGIKEEEEELFSKESFPKEVIVPKANLFHLLTTTKEDDDDEEDKDKDDSEEVNRSRRKTFPYHNGEENTLGKCSFKKEKEVSLKDMSFGEGLFEEEEEDFEEAKDFEEREKEKEK